MKAVTAFLTWGIFGLLAWSAWTSSDTSGLNTLLMIGAPFLSALGGLLLLTNILGMNKKVVRPIPVVVITEPSAVSNPEDRYLRL